VVNFGPDGVELVQVGEPMRDMLWCGGEESRERRSRV
jgi:hypothetical protein